jgi:hypothetical protein
MPPLPSYYLTSCSTSRVVSEKVEQSADGWEQTVPRWEHRIDDGAARLPLRQDMDKTPGADVFPDHNTRKLHDANAGQRSLTQHPNVVRPPIPYRRSDDAPVRRVDRNLASYVRPAPLDRSGFISLRRSRVR